MKCLTAQKHPEAENDEQNWLVIHFITVPDSSGDYAYCTWHVFQKSI